MATIKTSYTHGLYIKSKDGVTHPYPVSASIYRLLAPLGPCSASHSSGESTW